MNGIFIILFTAILGAGLEGLEQRTTVEKYKFDNPADFMSAYTKLTPLGKVEFSISGDYDKLEVRSVVCSVIDHDWVVTGTQAGYELAGSTDTAPLQTFLYDKEEDLDKDSNEFVRRYCKRCDLKEFWKYQTTIKLIKRQGD